MDQQLKQRLIGVTIFFTLVVIFVPMLFEKSDDKGRLTSGEVPSIPEDVLEKPLELPKTAEDLAPKEEAEKAKAESGYHIVPFNEEPPKPKEDANAKKPVEGEQAASEEEGSDEAGAKKAGAEGSPAAPAKPEKTKATAEVKPKAAAPKQEIPVEVDAEEEPPVAAPATPAAPVSKLAGKPETAAKKANSTHHAEISTQQTETPASAVRHEKAKAKPVPSASVEAEEEHATVSPKTPASAKPKPLAAAKPSEPPAKEAAKKPEPPKPAAKMEKTEPAGQTVTQPAAIPKPVEPAKAKAPTSWVVQAGSFTDEAGAKALADKLKQAKFPAYVEAVNGSHGQIYRVQVGPESELRKAQETLKQIGTNVGINGFIAPRH